MERKQLIQAEKGLQRQIEALQQADAKISSLTVETRTAAEALLSLSPEQRQIYDRIRGLQLRAKIVRNVRMNWAAWKQRNASVDVRTNQWEGLNQLIQFLSDDTYEFVQNGNTTCSESSEDDEEFNPLVGHYVQPTGAGKTGMMAIETALADVKTLIIVPFDNLMYQTERDLCAIGGIAQENIAILKQGATSDLYGRKVLVTTYAGHLARMKRDLVYRQMIQDEVELTFCDEGHMALGPRTQESLADIDEMAQAEMTEVERKAEQEVLEENGRFIPSKSIKIAVTATPKLAAKHVRQKFGRCIGRVYQADLVKAEYIVPYEIIQTDGTILDDDQILDRMTEGEEVKILHREEVYAKLLGEYAAAVQQYRKLKDAGDDEKAMPVYGMAFCTNHTECEKFVEDATAMGLRFEILTGEELAGGEKGRSQLKEAEQRLITGEIDGFVTVEKLATGYSPDFMNTILWARVTSSARTVQGIGRGGRRFTYQNGVKKLHCAVIEVNWSLMKGAKRKRTPLRLADALADQGENPEGICRMANGTRLDVRRQYVLRADGTVEIGGRLAVGVQAYAHNLQTQGQIGPQGLHKLVRDAGLQSIPDVNVRSGNGGVDVYWKDDVDRLLPRWIDDAGVVNVEGREAVALNKYAQSRKPKMGMTYLSELVSAAGLQPVKDARTMSRNKQVEVYWRDEVDALLPNYLGPEGVVTIRGREAVGIVAYANNMKPVVRNTVLLQYIKEAGLQPVPDANARSGKMPVDVYWRDEVDRLLPKRLGAGGVVLIGGREAVGLKAYAGAQAVPMKVTTLEALIEKADLGSVQNVRVFSGANSIAVFWKDEVDEVLRKAGR